MPIFESRQNPIAVPEISVTQSLFEGLIGREDEVAVVDGPTGRKVTAAQLMAQMAPSSCKRSKTWLSTRWACWRKPMKLLMTIAAFALASNPNVDTPSESEGRAPLIGLEGPETDACPGIGRISMFAPKKGDFMRVYPDAYETARIKDKLPLSSLVWLCEADEGWQGIVYPIGDNQDLGDCRVSSALADPEPYAGPCQFGWVEAKYIELVAG